MRSRSCSNSGSCFLFATSVRSPYPLLQVHSTPLINQPFQRLMKWNTPKFHHLRSEKQLFECVRFFESCCFDKWEKVHWTCHFKQEAGIWIHHLHVLFLAKRMEHPPDVQNTTEQWVVQSTCTFLVFVAICNDKSTESCNTWQGRSVQSSFDHKIDHNLGRDVTILSALKIPWILLRSLQEHDWIFLIKQLVFCCTLAPKILVHLHDTHTREKPDWICSAWKLPSIVIFLLPKLKSKIWRRHTKFSWTDNSNQVNFILK